MGEGLVLLKSLWHFGETKGEFELGRHQHCKERLPFAALSGAAQSLRAGWGPKSRRKRWLYFWEGGWGEWERACNYLNFLGNKRYRLQHL